MFNINTSQFGNHQESDLITVLNIDTDLHSKFNGVKSWTSLTVLYITLGQDLKGLWKILFYPCIWVRWSWVPCNSMSLSWQIPQLTYLKLVLWDMKTNDLNLSIWRDHWLTYKWAWQELSKAFWVNVIKDVRRNWILEAVSAYWCFQAIRWDGFYSVFFVFKH